MLSKLVKEMIEQKFGQEVRYPKDCEPLAGHILQVCKTRLSPSTLRRLFGFVKGTKEPQLRTLDLLAEYLGMKSWSELLASFDKSKETPVKAIEKIKPAQIKNGQTIAITYEPAGEIRIKRIGSDFRVTVSKEKKLLPNDQVAFTLIELHYPLTFSNVIREGKNIGRIQVATVSGVTGIHKA